MGEVSQNLPLGYTLADILKTFGREYLNNNPVGFQQKKVIYNIIHCKTAAMGCHWTKCPQCGDIQQHHNSCGDRHCPCCQGVNKEKWILEREYDMLPVTYFHVVFTVPAELRPLFLQNKELLYNLLFECSWETLNEFAWDKRQKLEAQIAATAILHTWTQKLDYHPHIHMIVPQGGIDKNNNWKTSKGNDDFLFYVPCVAAKFKGKFLDKLYRLFLDNKLSFNASLAEINSQKMFYQFKDKLFRKNWVVFTKESFKNSDAVVEYLGRYTHKIAISNYRIQDIDFQENTVNFSYLDREDEYKKKSMTIAADTFISKFLTHVLPKGFVRIRHYGFLSCRIKTKMLHIIRLVLQVKEPGLKPVFTVRMVMIITTGKDPYLCKKCKKGIVMEIARTPRIRGKPF